MTLKKYLIQVMMYLKEYAKCNFRLYPALDVPVVEDILNVTVHGHDENEPGEETKTTPSSE